MLNFSPSGVARSFFEDNLAEEHTTYSLHRGARSDVTGWGCGRLWKKGGVPFMPFFPPKGAMGGSYNS